MRLRYISVLKLPVADPVVDLTLHMYSRRKAKKELQEAEEAAAAAKGANMVIDKEVRRKTLRRRHTVSKQLFLSHDICCTLLFVNRNTLVVA